MPPEGGAGGGSGRPELDAPGRAHRTRQRRDAYGRVDRWALDRRHLMALDAAAMLMGVLVFGALGDLTAVGGLAGSVAALVGVPVAWVAAVASQGGYRSPERQRFSARFAILLRAVAWFLSATLIASVVLDSANLDLAALGAAWVAVLVGLGAGWLARAAHAARRWSGGPMRRVLAIGSPHVVAEYAERLESDPLDLSELVATMTLPARSASPDTATGATADGAPVLPAPRRPQQAELAARSRTGDRSLVEPISEIALAILARTEACDADEVVVVGGTDLTAGDFRDLAWLLDEDGRSLSVLPVTWDVAPHRVRVDQASGLSRVVVTSARRRPVSQVVKGVVDRLVALVVLLFALPFLGIVALAVHLDSPGPALFRQERVGRNGEVFTMMKFRTMDNNAEERKADLAGQNQHGSSPLFKMRNDPRVTRVGRVLRKTSLDELPQLINVLMGQMSLVGPRPALPDEVAAYGPRAQRRLAVKPGITGLWQVSGRSDLDWASSVDLDLRYIERWSVGLDVSILFRTLGAVVQSKGAY